ncbi:MAG: T9SS type A sorting domain-containing protein [Bacteroidales bacterium]|jgi:hypothetical protein|nr:T9SS type A sorting domain-containing protein [Bacteroidales bacterium]MDD4214439.1 T9SS type A sorting domain-containing protein [Bacteroidales bacterium]
MKRLLLFFILVTAACSLLAQPFGNHVSMDGVNDNIYLVHNDPNFIPENHDFTVELYFYTCFDGSNRIIDLQGSTAGTGLDIISLNQGQFLITSQPGAYGTATYILISVSSMVNQWHHIAWTYSYIDSMNCIYYDGNRIQEFKYYAKGPTNDIGIGSDDDDYGNSGLRGYLDEVRISDVVRYSGATYTVPADSFITDGNTLFLLHFDENKGESVFHDTGPHHYSVQGLFGSHIVEPFAVIGDTCITGPGTIQLWATGGTMYSWTPSVFLNDSSLAMPTASPTYPIMYYVTVSDTNQCSFTDSVFLDISVNTEEYVYENNSKIIYPNPAKSDITILIPNSNSGEIFIFDLAGKIIFQNKYFQPNINIDISNYKPGNYILKIFDKNATIIHQDIIIKQ